MPAFRSILSVLGVVGLAGLGYFGVQELRERRPRASEAERPDPGPVPVTLRRLAAHDVPLTVEAFGTLAAARRARLAPEIAGRIERRLEGWRPGFWVPAGTELVRVEDRIARLALEEAEALVRETEAALEAAELAVERADAELEPTRERRVIAQRELERGVELADEGIASASGIDALRSAERAAELSARQVSSRLASAKAEVRVRAAALSRAEAARASALDAVERSAVSAPFDGWLVGRAPDVGTYVGPTVVVAELVDLEELQLIARVAEIELEGLVEGRRAVVTAPSQPGREHVGRVRSVGVDADPAARSVAVEIAIANPSPPARSESEPRPRPTLVAGQFARARIEVGTLAAVVTIARKELVWRDGRPQAYVFDETTGRAVARELELGRALAEGFVVSAGLAAGDRLIVAPLDRIVDGVECRLAAGSESGG